MKQIPEVEESTKFNFITSIWIVPFIAILIAGWLAYQYFSELGPEIRIVFPKNEGLQAGQSLIKYRNVPVGTVKKIELQKDGEGIVVVARMDKTVASFLNKSTKLWIVKPEVGIGGISGLDTLISGTYINMFANKDDEFKDVFVGQSHAYRDDTRGEYFVLNTLKGDSSVKVGTPVYLKNIQVGQVEHVVLALDDASVDVIVFIENAYVPYLHVDSNFWIRSTFEAGFSNGTLNLAVAPITDLIQGAIEFSSFGKDISRKVPDAYIFKLHVNKSEVENTNIGTKHKIFERYSLYTDEPASKLHVGALVRYSGFEVGEVKGIQVHYDKKSHVLRSSIDVDINLAVFSDVSDLSGVTGKENFENAVKEGLRAQIVPIDPITGFLYIDMVFDDAEDNQTIYIGENGFSVLPTMKYKSGNMMASLTKIIDKINRLPLEKLLSSLNKVVEDAGKVVKHVDKPLVIVLTDLKKTISNLNKMTNKKSFTSMPDEVNKTLKELTRTLKTTKKVVKGYDNNSLITHQIAQTLKIVSQTSKEMQHFLKMLNRKPNSLIFGDK